MTTHFDWTQIQVEILDPALFRRIPLTQLCDYLKRTGWEIALHSPFGDIWELSAEQDRISCPMTEEIVDYPTRISHAVRILSRIENRSQILSTLCRDQRAVRRLALLALERSLDVP